jgi:hypothetical protein
MFATIINDCQDDNARGRQLSRLTSLLDTHTSFVGVQSDLQAGVQLIDILDATEGRRGLILINVAPRGGHTTKWENGTPFAFTWYKETLIVSSVDGFALSGLKQYLDYDHVSLLDIHTATDAMLRAGFINPETASRIPHSQFRSFDFTPRIGAFLMSQNDTPSTPYALADIPNLPKAIWHIDNFGNCKTTLTTKDLHNATELTTRFGTLPYIEHLRDVPDNQAAIITGSSGYGTHRFLELVCQRAPFAARYNAHIDDDIFTDHSYLVTATSLDND